MIVNMTDNIAAHRYRHCYQYQSFQVTHLSPPGIGKPSPPSSYLIITIVIVIIIISLLILPYPHPHCPSFFSSRSSSTWASQSSSCLEFSYNSSFPASSTPPLHSCHQLVTMELLPHSSSPPRVRLAGGLPLDLLHNQLQPTPTTN